MLDTDIKLVEVNLPSKQVKNEALVFNGCNVYIKDHHIIYSELEELSFNYLNSNDYDGFSLEVEFCFENCLEQPYHWFYANCFSIRTDNNLKIKISQSNLEKSLSKVNMHNQIVFGIGVFFRDEHEYQRIKDCNSILLEGFLAIDRYDNTFAIACRLEKIDNRWNFVYGNTYKMKKNDDIRSKAH